MKQMSQESVIKWTDKVYISRQEYGIYFKLDLDMLGNFLFIMN